MTAVLPFVAEHRHRISSMFSAIKDNEKRFLFARGEIQLIENSLDDGENKFALVKRLVADMLTHFNALEKYKTDVRMLYFWGLLGKYSVEMKMEGVLTQLDKLGYFSKSPEYYLLWVEHFLEKKNYTRINEVIVMCFSKCVLENPVEFFRPIFEQYECSMANVACLQNLSNIYDGFKRPSVAESALRAMWLDIFDQSLSLSNAEHAVLWEQFNAAADEMMKQANTSEWRRAVERYTQSMRQIVHDKCRIEPIKNENDRNSTTRNNRNRTLSRVLEVSEEKSSSMGGGSGGMSAITATPVPQLAPPAVSDKLPLSPSAQLSCNKNQSHNDGGRCYEEQMMEVEEEEAKENRNVATTAANSFTTNMYRNAIDIFAQTLPLGENQGGNLPSEPALNVKQSAGGHMESFNMNDIKANFSVFCDDETFSSSKPASQQSVARQLQGVAAGGGEDVPTVYKDEITNDGMMQILNSPQTMLQCHDFSNEKCPRVEVGGTTYFGGEAFHVTRLIGQGGFAKVYHAISEDRLPSAIKFESPACPREVYICDCLKRRMPKHMLPFVMDIRDAYIFFNASAIIYDYYPCGTLLDLSNHYKKEGMEMGGLMVTFFAIQLGRVLEQVHAARIIHADVKPDNIVITMPSLPMDASLKDMIQMPVIKVIDWGRAIEMNYNPNKRFVGRAGTKNFECIEMILDLPWNYQTDFFGFVATIHVLLFNEYLVTTQTNGKYHPVKQIKRRLALRAMWLDIFEQFLNIPSCDHLPSWNKVNSFMVEQLKEEVKCQSVEWKRAVERYNQSAKQISRGE